MAKRKEIDIELFDEEDEEKETRVSFDKITETSYDLYKLNWIDENVSLAELKQKYADYENFYKQMRARKFRKKEIPDYDKYVEDMGGYKNGIYETFDEFLQNEFLNGDYMCELLIDEPELYDSYVGNAKTRNKIRYGKDVLSSSEIDEMLKKGTEVGQVEYDDYEM